MSRPERSKPEMTGGVDGVAVLPVAGIGEVTSGTDLTEVFARNANLAKGDVLVVTSKVVSKAEGRVVESDRASALAAETERVVARRGGTAIVRTRHGLVMAGAGVDESNTRPGTVVLLPRDPDGTARSLREGLAAATGANVAVLVTDTSGRAWRNGQTDIAIGAAGLEVMHDLAGQGDGYGNVLSVTLPAVADELAGAADLVKGKLARCPAAVVRGLARLVLPPGRHGPGAIALVRDEEEDMFGYGAREAVAHAVSADRAARRGFGHGGTAGELTASLVEAGRGAVTAGDTSDLLVEVTLRAPSERELGRLEGGLAAVAFAFGWVPDPWPAVGPDRAGVARFRPAGP